MLTCCIHRTDFPGGIIWWHDYDIAKRRGHWPRLHLSAAVRLCVLHTSTHHHRFPSFTQCTCLYPTVIDLCDHATIGTSHQVTPCRSHRTGHAESLYIAMRTPANSFSSRAEKTNKGSPAPPSREEVYQLCSRQSVAAIYMSTY